MENFTDTGNATPFNSWLSGKWFTDTSGLLLDFYARQFKSMANAITDFYQLADPVKSTRVWADGSPFEWNNFLSRYFKLINNSWTSLLYGGNFIGRMNQSYSASMEQFSSFNQEIFNVFQTQLQKDEKDFQQFHQVIDKFVNDQLQLSKHVMDAVNAAINNRISFHSEIGKKTAEAFMKQQDVLNEQSKKIMEEWNTAVSKQEKTETTEKTFKKKKEELVPA